ncbi:hypothetical protein V8E54_013314 [Elaphomyces granulatus]
MARVIRSKRHWHSRTMTIVADADTGILITGATKPAAPEIPTLEDAADNISHMRAGDEFGSVIGTCSRENPVGPAGTPLHILKDNRRETWAVNPRIQIIPTA